MEYAISDLGDGPTITLSGRFTYDDSRRFHELVNAWDFGTAPSPRLDCRYLTFVDSTAIGMLFLFARRCQEAGGTPTVTGTHPTVAHALRRASMDSYFIIT